MSKNVIKSVLVIALMVLTTQIYAQENETRNVLKFTKIGLAVSADLYLVQGGPQKVVLEGDKDDLAKIKTKVSGNTLEIEKKKGTGRIDKVKIYVTVPKIEAVAVAGSGDVYAKGTIKNDNLELSVAGSGDMFFAKLDVSDIKLNIAGSGNMKIAGKPAENTQISIAGSGDVDTKQLQVDKISISIAGSGNVKCYATKKIKASLTGSGDVAYKGNPIINVESVGSGSVESLN